MSRTLSRVIGWTLLALAAVLVLVSLWMTYQNFLVIHSWLDSRDWQSISGSLEAIQVEEDGPTESERLRYRYRWRGEEFQGDQLGVDPGDFMAHVRRDLAPKITNGEPVTVWFDPDDPAESLLIRDLPPTWFQSLLLPVLILMLIGTLLAGLWGALATAEANRNRYSRFQARGTSLPEGDRIDRAIRCAESPTDWAIAGFGLLITLYVIPFLLLFAEPVDGRKMIVGLLLLCGLAMIAYGILRVILARGRHGWVFLMTPSPVSIGAKLEGELQLPGQALGETAKVRLVCRHQYWVSERAAGGGESRSSRVTQCVWEDARDIGSTGEDSRVRISFPLPADAPASEERGPGDRVFWTLVVTAGPPGFRNKAQFEIPIGPRPESRDPVDDDVFTMADILEHAEGGDLADSGVRHSVIADGERYYQPPGRLDRRSVGYLVAVAFLLGFLALAIGLTDDSSGAWILVGLLGLLLVLTGIMAYASVMMRIENVVSENGLQHRWGPPFTGTLERYSKDQIECLTLARSKRHSANTVTYELCAQLHDNDRPLDLAQQIPGRRPAVALATEIANKLGVELRTAHREQPPRTPTAS